MRTFSHRPQESKTHNVKIADRRVIESGKVDMKLERMSLRVEKHNKGRHGDIQIPKLAQSQRKLWERRDQVLTEITGQDNEGATEGKSEQSFHHRHVSKRRREVCEIVV